MKKILVLSAYFVFNLSFSQEMIKSLDLGISKNAEVFQIVEEEKKQVSLFFSARINVMSIRFDENFNVIDSLKAKKPSYIYEDIVGYSLSGNKYYAYWSSSNGKEIMAQGFDFEKKEVTYLPTTLELEKEKIIKKLTLNNIFYIISIVKNTGVLNFYAFKDGMLDKKSIDLSDKTFENKNDQTTNLWGIVSNSTNFESAFSFQTIATETMPSLAFSAKKHKVYVLGNKLLFTLDDNCRFTQTFTIDLNNFSATTKIFPQPFFKGDFYSFDSNSFLLDNKIIQIKNSSDNMTIMVKDMDGNQIKELNISNQEIEFKNSEINQENGSTKSFRVLDKTSQFLRKINGNNPAISLYEANQKIYMIIGGVSNIQQNNGMMFGGGMMVGATGVMIGVALTSNYSLNNLNSYKQRKVVYINCLFDKDFNHLEGEVKKTGFDELREFSESKDNLIAPVVFKLNSNLFYGGNDMKAGSYQFYKFND